MKKTFFTLIVLTIACINTNAQTWTNYPDGHSEHYNLTITDSLIFAGCEGVINIYSSEGEYISSKLTNYSNFSSTIDYDGNIWFSNRVNILKFDGENWSNYRPDVPEGKECYSIACDKDNNMWATFCDTNNGDAYISKFDGVNWENITTFGDSVSIYYSGEIVIDTNNNVYVGIKASGNNWTYGVVKISEMDTTIFHYGNSNCNIACKHSSCLDKNNHVWYGGCYNLLGKYDGSDWLMEGEDPELLNKSFSAIYKDLTDKLWLGTPSGIFIENEDTWIEYTKDDELEYDYIFEIKNDSNDNIWIACGEINNYHNGCLTKHSQTGFTHYFPNTFKGEPQKVVFREDEIWVTTTVGVSYFVDGVWHNNEINGIQLNDSFRDIVNDNQNNIWMISDTLLYKVDSENNIEIISEILGNDFISNRKLAAYENTIWLNSYPMLLKYEGESWSEIPLDENLSIIYSCLIPVNSDEIWIGTTEGALHYNQGIWNSLTEEDGLVKNSVKDIDFDGDTIWFATSGGISSFNGTNWVSYIHDSTNFNYYNKYSSLHIDKNGDKWTGCWKGVYKYDNNNFSFIQPNNGFEEFINYITEDNDGNIWVAGQYGLSKYTFEVNNIDDSNISDQALEIYPNPATNNFQINLSNSKEPDLLKIYTITGKCIFNQKVVAGINDIKLCNIPAGVYIVKLKKSQKYCKLVIE